MGVSVQSSRAVGYTKLFP